MITTVLFDFFDVLCPDDYKAWLQRHGYKKEGKFLTVSEQLDHGQITTEQFFERLADISKQDLTMLRRTFVDEPIVDRDVLAIVQALRANYKVALVSNAPSQFLRDILKKLDLEQYFDAIIISSEVGHIKPNKEIFDYALAELRSLPTEAVFVDDNPRYVEGARTVGLHGLVFTHAKQLANDLQSKGIVLTT